MSNMYLNIFIHYSNNSILLLLNQIKIVLFETFLFTFLIIFENKI